MKYLIALFSITFAAHAFASEGLNDAFQAALANSEQDHQKQQVAFKVSPEQVEKATFKRVAHPQIVDVPASALTDAPSAPAVEAAPAQAEPQMNQADDLAAVKQELNSDIK